MVGIIMIELSKELIQYLKLCGYSEAQIKECTPNTKLYHELGVYGDVAYDHISNLEEMFGVDLSLFVFEEYFPDEFIGKTKVQKVFYWFLPWLSPRPQSDKVYKPITLNMLEQFILNKKWIDVLSDIDGRK
jgi:hypothetical protein